MKNRKKAVVLLSGGLDSATALAMAKAEGFDCYALSFRYGQRHMVELECASQVAKMLKTVEHRTVEIDLGAFGGSALTDTNIDVPHEAGDEDEIPITYVPARNTIFLSYALAWAEVLGCTDIFIGVNALDYSGYPDCRPEFITAYEKMANLATRAGVTGEEKLTIHAPLIDLTKAQIITTGLELGVDYGQTTSCYDPAPDGKACGTCDSCRLRLKGFKEAGTKDPRKYEM
ncbi:7-cyano-7-deazaguanine synthase QueC [Tichowtungia aerotolerans]|uniref:7-cyano-7-deazaguanine synthase n=1 Tax=Tichowtungia aerotolerans TaxID=2697043 RepID=A0A6P1M7R5_9BACT|nr:7-cyano-7-deazaguanine synthase QueC [Tichowtungia aerotolerans]QHI69911.1 7-cyano-7-deazaguanine synthase QueC [Tichowtungia aerotolerans]